MWGSFLNRLTEHQTSNSNLQTNSYMPNSLPPYFRVCADKAALSHAVASEMVSIIQETLKQQDYVSIAMAGGSTPKMLYSLLASEAYAPAIAWERLLLFWGDERYVPLTHEKSNFKMAKEALLDHVPLLPDHIFPTPTTPTNPHDGAETYSVTLKEQLKRCGGRLDIVLLGMGDDGHTASLFPGSPALDEQDRMAIAAPAPVEPRQRITLTYPVLNNARTVFFLVSGENKADALDCVLGNPSSVTVCPSSAIQPTDGTLVWWVDEAASHRYTQEAA